MSPLRACDSTQNSRGVIAISASAAVISAVSANAAWFTRNSRSTSMGAVGGGWVAVLLVVMIVAYGIVC